ncbi:biotin-dependent carboxyltransferase family protein [Sciscionella sediminilitoris]|uniref:5-oxoprolinase subunit C family protein n=1 Tax=Sciscionella sediminilitoris TaxID=1445613 RepID=UPI0005675AFE|nr:biotin-dependent carboxyltransferase family protein [Sciscionella sp. SE31]
MLSVLEPGPLTTVQDLGRTGYAHLGVSPSGAADREALRMANRLVGNPPGSPAFECTLGGLRLRFGAARIVAVTGAPVPVSVNGRPVADAARLRLGAGDELALGTPCHGLRSYLAVAGGLLVETVLGGAGHDLLAGHGPSPVRRADTFRIGEPHAYPVIPTELAVNRIPFAELTAEFRWGPRDDLFDAAQRQRFITGTWRVSAETNRVGARLSGTPLESEDIHIASEGMVRGSVQIPPSGQPIVFLADHPVTGGYPVIGVVTERDIDKVAQAAPGSIIHFRPLPRRTRTAEAAA